MAISPLSIEVKRAKAPAKPKMTTVERARVAAHAKNSAMTAEQLEAQGRHAANGRWGGKTAEERKIERARGRATV